jgi:hypothetical protein
MVNEDSASLSGYEASPSSAAPLRSASLGLDTFNLGGSSREQSPLKEALITKFARFAPAAAAAAAANDLSSHSPASLPVSINDSGQDVMDAHHQPSWLHNVKGRIAKTVEEKYSEYKSEREQRRQQQQVHQPEQVIEKQVRQIVVYTLFIHPNIFILFP